MELAEQALSSEQLAARYNMSIRGIEGWRAKGEGPRWFMAGHRAMYRGADVLAWEEAEAERLERERASA